MTRQWWSPKEMVKIQSTWQTILSAGCSCLRENMSKAEGLLSTPETRCGNVSLRVRVPVFLTLFALRRISIAEGRPCLTSLLLVRLLFSATSFGYFLGLAPAVSARAFLLDFVLLALVSSSRLSSKNISPPSRRRSIPGLRFGVGI